MKKLIILILVLIALWLFLKPRIRSAYIPCGEAGIRVGSTVTLVEYRLPYSWNNWLGYYLTPSHAHCSGEGCKPDWWYYDFEIERRLWDRGCKYQLK